MTALIVSTLSILPTLAYYDQPGTPGGSSYWGGGLYWLILIGTMVLSGIAAMRVRSAYAHYSQVPASSGLSGAQIAQRILDANGIRDVSIHATQGHLTDHYDPTNKRLVLSEENYHGTSVAALGVSAHECGHAIQHHRAYAPLQWRMAAVGITNIAANPLILMFAVMGAAFGWILPSTAVLILAVAYGILMLFQLITLPVEFDATARAKKIVPEIGAMSGPEEFRGMSKVLDAAAWTYVAAFISVLATFLYYASMLLGRRDE